MQQCREPYSLAPSRRLAHGCQPIRRGIPAQCPGRGCLTAVPLGRGPSLHGLRRGNALIVRPLHRYNSLVRLLIRVHAHRSAFAFMSRSGMPCRTRMRPPRFRAKNFSTCTRPSTARGSTHASHYAMGDVAFSSENWIGTSELDPFRSSILGPWSPLGTLHGCPHEQNLVHHSGSGWLARPSPWGTSTSYSLPASWRTRRRAKTRRRAAVLHCTG